MKKIIFNRNLVKICSFGFKIINLLETYGSYVDPHSFRPKQRFPEACNINFKTPRIVLPIRRVIQKCTINQLEVSEP